MVCGCVGVWVCGVCGCVGVEKSRARFGDTSMRKVVGAVILLSVVVSAALVRNAVATLSPEAAVARLKKDEGAIGSGRLTLLTVERQGALPEGVGEAAAREAEIGR